MFAPSAEMVLPRQRRNFRWRKQWSPSSSPQQDQ
jgi:hypothetical protein